MQRLPSAFILLGTLLALIPVGSIAQTASDLDRNYQRVTAFVVRPTILLTAKFGRDARVCQMVLEPHRDSVLVATLSQEETIRAIEEVVPESERGKRLKGDGWSEWLKSDVRGRSITTTFPYELMTVTFHGTVEDGDSMVAEVSWEQRSCDK